MIEGLDAIRLSGLLPTVAVDNPEDILPTCAALEAGGLNVMEITLRTPGAYDAIRLATREHPDMYIGAGTVLRPEQAEKAQECGAKYLVTPGCNRVVLQSLAQNGLPVIPGCGSGGEVEFCLEQGFDVVKIFPAEQLGGLKFLKALSGPYGSAWFVPMGGVSVSNIGEYIAFERVFACGGSWIANPKLMAARDFAGIERNAREAIAAMLRVQLTGIPRAREPFVFGSRSPERLDYYLSKAGVAAGPNIEFVRE